MGRKKLLRIFTIFFLFLMILEGTGHLIACKASRTHPFLFNHKGKDRFLISENAILKKKIEALQPNELIIVVDTASNTLSLYQDRKIILRAIASCGSGAILTDPNGNREWIFETPRGEFIILSKYENTAWIKPEWAFIEEGKPIPKSVMERVELGILGNYALGFGKGYFIHGTLYSRLLGKNITHGCIRVGDQDLKRLYDRVPLGTKILIF